MHRFYLRLFSVSISLEITREPLNALEFGAYKKPTILRISLLNSAVSLSLLFAASITRLCLEQLKRQAI